MKTKKTLFLGAVTLLLTAAAARAEHWSFATTPGDVLEVDLRTGGSIEIRGGGADQVVVDSEAHGPDAEWIRVTAEKRSSGVRIHSEYTRDRRNQSGGADITVTVPEKYDLDLSTMGGHIRIEGVEGKMSGETMGGGLELRDLKGSLALSTMGGSVEVWDSTVDGKVSSMGGNVTFHRVAGGLKGTTMGGRVRIVDSPGAGAGASDDMVVELSTMGGDIDVAKAPQGANVSTMGGDITIGSAGKFVKVKTMGGKIRLDEVDGRVEATTMAGDVSVRVVGSGGDVDIQSMSGDVEIWLPADFGATFDVELAYTQGMHSSYEIRSDFPLEQTRTEDWEYGHGSPRKYIRATGRTGSGTHTVKLGTINGDIVIHRGR